MLIIDSASALEAARIEGLEPILTPYAELMDLAVVYILMAGDSAGTLERVRRRPFAEWEFILRHQSGWFEAVFVESDDGAGAVVFLPDQPNVAPPLVELCRAHAEDAALKAR